MTHAPEPNDLSHLSDEEFHALCPLGEHAPGPEPLSPAAQAVLDAYGNEVGGSAAITSYERRGIAAALRAAADQVVPEEPLYGGDQRWMFERDARQERRKKLLAIAAELEGADQATSLTH